MQLAVLLGDHLVLARRSAPASGSPAAAPASRCGPSRPAPGRTPRSRRPACRRSSRRRSGPGPRSTSLEANDSDRVAAETTSAAIRRVRSANAGRRRIVQAATGKTAARTRVSSSGSPKFRSARLPLDVEIRAAPTTREPNSSGRSAASPMIVMPPIEWPTSTTGPRGTRASRTAARSRASCSIVEFSECPRPGRAVAALVVEDQPRVGTVPVRGGQLGGEGPPLEVQRGHRQRVAVHEDDGQRRVRRGRSPRPPAGRRRRSAPARSGPRPGRPDRAGRPRAAPPRSARSAVVTSAVSSAARTRRPAIRLTATPTAVPAAARPTTAPTMPGGVRRSPCARPCAIRRHPPSRRSAG